MAANRSGVAVVGNLNMDLLMGPLDGPPVFGHEMFVPERSLRSAGQAFYTAAALAALGEPPRLLGDVGDDAFGAQILDDLRAAGIDTGAIRVCAGTPTGLTVALLNQARDRAFVTHPGHLAALSAGDVVDRWAHVADRRVLLLCGYNCLPGLRPDGGVEVLAHARSAGLVTALDTGWDPDGQDDIRAMLAHTDVFLPNREEAQALTDHDDPARAAAELAAWGPGTVIVKLGPDGALGLRDSTQVRVPALPAKVADTVGAGDTFNAGVLYALARDWTLEDAMRLGGAVAAYTIADHTPRYPTLDQARELMRGPGAPA